MALKTIMLLLTLAGDGTAHVNFSQTDTLDACEAKIQAVRKVLDKTGTEIIDIRCGQSALAVEKYKRGLPKEAPRFPYRVTLTATGFEAVADADGSCTPSTTAAARVICATSTQEPLAK